MVELLTQTKIFAASCESHFFGIPTWYKYLKSAGEQGNQCAPKLTNINDIWLVALAGVEIVLRIAVIVAIIYVVIGGFKLMTSEGNPDKTVQGRKTVIDGLIGLVIAIVATGVVGFIATRFSG